MSKVPWSLKGKDLPCISCSCAMIQGSLCAWWLLPDWLAISQHQWNGGSIPICNVNFKNIYLLWNFSPIPTIKKFILSNMFNIYMKLLGTNIKRSGMRSLVWLLYSIKLFSIYISHETDTTIHFPIWKQDRSIPGCYAWMNNSNLSLFFISILSLWVQMP